MRDALSTHWPEYLIEGLLLGCFMVVACVGAALLGHPDSPLSGRVQSSLLRRGLMGLTMGLTAITLIYSPLGARSGAHVNPAVTLAMLALGRVTPIDAMFYVLAQIIGGISGVWLCRLAIPGVIRHPSVSHVVTVPGPRGRGVALVAEAAMSAILMAVVLVMTGTPSVAAYTGLVCGALVAVFITVEAPISGMSMNPARSLGSAMVAGRFDAFWIYVLAPVGAMLLTAGAYAAITGEAHAHCAKINHPTSGACIFGCEGSHPTAVPSADISRGEDTDSE